MRFEIDSDCLYDRAELSDKLKPLGIDVDHFIAKIRPRKVFRMAWLGSDLLEAYRNAPPLSDTPTEPEDNKPSPKRGRPRRGGRRPFLTDEEIGAVE